MLLLALFYLLSLALMSLVTAAIVMRVMTDKRYDVANELHAIAQHELLTVEDAMDRFWDRLPADVREQIETDDPEFAARINDRRVH